MSQPNEKRPNLVVDVLMGLLLSVLGMLAAFGASFTVAATRLAEHLWWVFGTFAGTGAVYFALTIRWALLNKRQGIMIGLIIGAALFVLLSSACYSLLTL